MGWYCKGKDVTHQCFIQGTQGFLALPSLVNSRKHPKEGKIVEEPSKKEQNMHTPALLSVFRIGFTSDTETKTASRKTKNQFTKVTPQLIQCYSVADLYSHQHRVPEC